jgi:hypothetical protein
MEHIEFKKFLKVFNEEIGENTTIDDFEGFDGAEKVARYPILSDKSITVWHWYCDESGFDGFIRDDNTGISIIVTNMSRDDQLRLAAWNADFDIRKLSEYLDDDDLNLALQDAAKNEWGFESNNNNWDE